MKTLLWLALVLALAVGGYLAYARWGRVEQALSVVTTVVTRGDIVQSIAATGRIEALMTVQVGSQVSGTIKTLNADFNSRVKRGEVIAELEPSLFATQVEQAKATVTRLQAEVERARVQVDDTQLKLMRARDLAARQLLSAADLESAETSAKAAEAGLRSAEAQVVQAQASLNQSRVNLSYTVIRAPIDGVVISRNVDVGQTVAASMQAPTLFQIANDLAQMRVNANIDESDIGLVMPGQPATFQVDAFPGMTFSGTVSQVRLNPVIESNVVSYVTVINVANPDLLLRPGMTANVTVEVSRASDVLRVPTSALRFSPTPALFASLGQAVPEAPAVRPASGPSGATSEGRSTGPGARAGGAGAGTSASGRAGGNGQQDGGRGLVWASVDGQLQAVPVRTGISDGANVAILGGALQEGVVIATGVTQASAAVAPTAGSPLIPQFGRRGGGAAQRNGGQGGGARGGQ